MSVTLTCPACCKCCSLTAISVLYATVSSATCTLINGVTVTLTWDGTKWSGAVGSGCSGISMEVQCVSGNLTASFTFADVRLCGIGQMPGDLVTTQCYPLLLSLQGTCGDYSEGLGFGPTVFCCSAATQPIYVTITL